MINLLVDLQERLHLSYIFIAHDLGVVRYISTRVAVMYLGRIVETGPTEEVFHSPAHPYTEALLSSMLSTDPDSSQKRLQLEGDVPAQSICLQDARFIHGVGTISRTSGLSAYAIFQLPHP